MELYGDFKTSVIKALSEIDENWQDYKGLIICGSHSPRKEEIEVLIDKIKRARENGTPALLVCYGFQLAAIEYACNVLKIKDATSEEWGQGTFVVKQRPKLKVGLHEGEIYWSNYEVAIEWDKPKHFFATPAHPEYQSSKEKPHSLLVEFLLYAKQMAN